MKTRNIVGTNIRRLRINAGYTQENLALKSSLSQGFINQLESGKRRYTQNCLELIAGALDVSIIDLFKEESKIFNDQPIVGEEPVTYKSIRPSKKGFMDLISKLPDQVVEHYFMLMTLEKKIRDKEVI
ncbi:MAG: helix-turn-helix domain-containing protein [Candidatus Anammoxibacter sp.]